MKQRSTLFLKFVLVLIAVGAVAGMAWFPQTEGRAMGLDLLSIYTDPFVLYMDAASIPFFVALTQAFRLLSYVDKNKIFSKDSVQAVQTIKYCALTFTGFLLVAIAYIFVLSKTTTEDGAGAMMFGFIIVFASTVITTAVGVLQKVLQNAVDLKSENDLTV